MDQHTDAPTMSGRLTAGPITTAQAIDYGLSLAKELKRRHQMGVVAGSLHPDRISLNGVSASILENRDAGISRYSAPEQWDGRAGDTRSDVFSFGAVFYELLTGHPVVDGNSPEEWKESLARRESGQGNGVAPEFAQLLDRCLKRRPEDRWQNVSVVVVELKLLAASTRHAKAAADWKHWVSSVEQDLGHVGGQLAAHQSAHEAALREVHRSIGDVATKTEEHAVSVAAAAQTLGTLGQTVTAATQKLGELDGSVSTAHDKLTTLGDSMRDLTGKTDLHARTLESLQSAVTQTDEVIDHVVDAFDSMHRLVLDQAETGTAVASQRPS